MRSRRRCARWARLLSPRHRASEETPPFQPVRLPPEWRHASWIPLPCPVQSLDGANRGNATTSTKHRRSLAPHTVDKGHPLDIECLVDRGRAATFHHERYHAARIPCAVNFDLL